MIELKLSLSIFVSVINAASKNLSLSCSSGFRSLLHCKRQWGHPKASLGRSISKVRAPSALLFLYPYRWASCAEKGRLFPCAAPIELIALKATWQKLSVHKTEWHMTLFRVFQCAFAPVCGGSFSWLKLMFTKVKGVVKRCWKFVIFYRGFEI